MTNSQTVTLFFLIFHLGGSLANNSCEDWEPYKDEKCLKIFNQPGLLSYEDAENFCKSTDESNLISIGLEQKQQFVANFLRSNEVVDNVWIGLKRVNDNYEWSDGTEMHYTNWAENNPKNDSAHCAQIQTDEDGFGKWSDVLCTKKNLVLCEKIQSWSMSYLQNTVIELQFSLNQSKQAEKNLDERVKSLEGLIGELKGELGNLKDTVTDISKNPFPVGFIYVQLPNEQAPSDVWPWMGWQDVSPNYAGLFFRAEGGNSAPFGSVQEENSPRLKHIKKIVKSGTLLEIDVTADGNPSKLIDVEQTRESNVGFQFTVSGGEVRPRNMAVRIWKRTG